MIKIFDRVKNADHNAYAILGKQILSQLTPEQIKTLINSSEIENVYVQNQSLKPTKVYRIKIPSSRSFQKTCEICWDT